MFAFVVAFLHDRVVPMTQVQAISWRFLIGAWKSGRTALQCTKG